MRELVAGLALCLAFCSVSGAGVARAEPALPGIGDGARRVVVPVDAMPWRILGRVQTELGGRCTGFAVAPDVVMTAAHCLWLPKTRRFIQPGHVHVLMGYDHGRYRKHVRVVRFIVAPGYDPLREGGAVREDRATLIVDGPVAETSGLVPFVAVQGKVSAMLAGYSQDRQEVAFGDLGCSAGMGSDGVVHHDCEGTRGVSGAPLFVRSSDGGWGIGGLAVRAFAGAGGLAVPLGN